MPQSKLDASDIIFNIFSFFKREKERGILNLSVDKLWQRTLAATGVSKTTVYIKFNQDLVRRTVFALHSEWVPPTLAKIQDRIKDSIEISKYKLAIALNELGFSFRKRGKNIMLKKPSKSSLTDVTTCGNQGSSDRRGFKWFIWMRLG